MNTASQHYNDQWLRKCKSENDVLYTDIKGAGLLQLVKRFYHDMFLLSYSDKRARRYLITCHAMTRERARQYRRYPGTIHPFSKFRTSWEYFILFICLAKQFILIYNTSIFVTEKSCFFIGFSCEFLSIVDLFVSMNTGYVDEDNRYIVLDSKLILIKFFSTRVFLHALGAIPLHGILYLRNRLRNQNCTLCNTSIFVTTIRFFSTLGLARSFDATVVLEREHSYFMKTALSRLCRIIILAFITGHWIYSIYNTIFMLIIIVNNEVDDKAINIELLIYWYSMEPSDRPNFFCLVIDDLTRYLFLHHVDNELECNVLEKCTTIIAYFSSNFYYVWVIKLGLDVAFQALFTEAQLMIQVERAVNMFASRHLPDDITQKVKSYYLYPEAGTAIVEKMNGLYAALPNSLKNEIARHCYSRHLSRVPFFVELPTKIMDEIVLLVKEEIFMTGDVVSEKGAKGDGMLILDKGIVAVYSERGEELEHFIDGDYFDIMSLFSDRQFNANTMVAVSNTKILFLDKHRFRRLMKNYPDQFFKLRHQLLNSGKARNHNDP